MAYSYKPGSARDLEKAGTRFRDADGRFVTFRGVNFAGSSKLPPYLPVRPKEAVPNADYDRLTELGFNVVRLLVIWKALEPEPQPDPRTLSAEGVGYLEQVRSVIDALYARGIFVFIDFHQDIAHEIYGGDGFPDWALAVDPDHPLPDPADFRDKQWALNYAVWTTRRSQSCRHTLASFWRNNLRNDRLDGTRQEHARRVRDHFAKTIGATAGWFQALNGGAGHPAILGYELFNEPHETELSPRELETQVLPEMYRLAADEIRAAGDHRSFLFVEPRVTWNDRTLDPKTELDTANLAAERTVYSYHHYDGWTIGQDWAGQKDSMENKQKEWPALYDRMLAAASSRGLIPFLTELGASHDWEVHQTDLRPEIYGRSQTRAYMDIQLQQADRQVLNWTYWNYNLYNDHELHDGWNLENFSLLGPGRTPRHTDIVARPYPLRSSAEPVAGFFDLGTKVFALRLQGAVVAAPTVLYLPRRIHYKADFDVRATTKHALEWDDKRQLLYWWPDPARQSNLILVTPPGSKAGVPPFAQDLVPALNRAIRFFNPFGFLDEATPVEGGIRVGGWAIDPEVAGPIDVHFYVDGKFVQAARAEGSRPDVGAAFPGYGNNHGFSATVPAAAGSRRVCAYAINVGAGTTNPELGCRQVTVPIPAACRQLEAEVADLQLQIEQLQTDMSGGPRPKPTTTVLIRRLQAQLDQKKAELAECLRRAGSP